MSTVLQSKPAAQENLAEKLSFQQKLQTVTNKIHATKNLDEIIIELPLTLCGADEVDVVVDVGGVLSNTARMQTI